MHKFSEEIADLSPAQRAMLELRLKEKRAGVSLASIKPQRRANAISPLSFAQQRLWFLDQLEPDNSFYNLPEAIRLRGRLNLSALRRTLSLIIQRHESLRTTFGINEGRPVQIIHAQEDRMMLPLVDMSLLAAESTEAEAMRVAAEEAAEPFNLAIGPLLRAKVLRLGAEEHVVLMTMHHIISDGWSMGVFIREVVHLYSSLNGGVEGAETALEPLPIQYADYAIWQREWLTGEVLDNQLSYWKEQLQGAAPVLELPTDKPRPALQTFNGARYRFDLSASLSLQLRELSKGEGVTLFMTLLAAFYLLLFRYTSQSDISIGTPVAGRSQLETESLIGFFVNTLVLRVEVRAEESFRELVRRVREVALGGYGHQDLPFEKLVEEMEPEREMSRSPLFQVMFVLQNMPREELALNGIEMRTMRVESETAKFDLTLTVIEQGEELSIGIEYNTGLYEAETIRRMGGHYEQVLKAVVKEPEQRIGRIELLKESERRQLLEEWNETQVRYEDADMCLHQLVEAQAERTPQAIALVYEEEQMSYGELNERANQLAHYLQQHDIKAESIVGILMHRSVEMVISLLGVLKAGAAYLPLDPSYPQERLNFMIDDAGVSLLLSHQHLAQSLNLNPLLKVINLEEQWQQIELESCEQVQSTVYPENLAYVIYTSGSTGSPKAAMNSHHAIVNRLLWMQHHYWLTSQDSVLQKTPFSFDVSVWEFFWPLLAGARLVLARPHGQKEPAYLAQLIADEQITVLHFVPSMLEVFLETEGVGAACRSVRQMICSGEALGAELVAKHHERMGGELDNLYGPTETAVDVSVWRCERGVEAGVVAIGKGIANTELYILDEEGELVPEGVRGELYIGGAGVGRGYLNRAEMTAERFVPHPFSREAGARLYRTGDVARYLEDGNIEYVGRKDGQVKVRGYRIELGEIEAVLTRHEAVRQAVVMLQQDGAANDKRLVCYVVATGDEDGAELGMHQLRQYLKEQLPEYMVPSAIVRMVELPLTPNGKLDRRALPAPDSMRPELESMFVGPRTAVEAELSAMWRELLRIEQISIYDNFFELGGHSLLLTQLASRVRNAYQVELPLRMLFDAPTIEDMTMALAVRQMEQEESAVVLRLLEELRGLSVAEVKALLEVEELNDFQMPGLAF